VLFCQHDQFSFPLFHTTFLYCTIEFSSALALLVFVYLFQFTQNKFTVGTVEVVKSGIVAVGNVYDAAVDAGMIVLKDGALATETYVRHKSVELLFFNSIHDVFLSIFLNKCILNVVFFRFFSFFLFFRHGDEVGDAASTVAVIVEDIRGTVKNVNRLKPRSIFKGGVVRYGSSSFCHTDFPEIFKKFLLNQILFGDSRACAIFF
jgi:hypothetical protein